jgi:hypothetical protein
MQNSVLSETNNFLSSITKKQTDKPTNNDFIFYTLAKEFGITDLNKYPIPYLKGLIDTHNYIKKLEEREAKKKR